MSTEHVADSIPTGYKQTEVGVIPEDWSAKTWGDVIIHCFSGATPSRSRPDFFKGDIRWITSGELNYNIINDTYEKITQEAVEKTNLKILPKKTFLMAITGLEAEGTRGSCAIVGEESTTNQSCMAIFTNEELKVQYLFHYYVFKGKELALQYCQGTKQQSYTAKIVKLLPITVPPLPEQEAIATALSDTDALIESLEQLIAKKRQIKQGAMQELLTGKRRLPGFSEEWEVKCVGDVLKIAHGRNQHAVEDQKGIYPILATGGQIGTANQFLYDKPSVLIGRKGTIDKPQFMDKPFWTVDTLFYSIILEPNNAKFLYYKFCLIDWKQYNEASGVPSLNARTIEQIVVKVPSSEEQTAIATILSDMDAEITSLEEKLSKIRHIKQGMMQELLTGRIRLV